MRTSKYFAITFTILTLFGCSSHENESKSGATANKAGEAEPNGKTYKNTEKCGQINSKGIIKVCHGIVPSEYTIPHGKVPAGININTPDSDYLKINDGAQIMFYYAAYSKAQPSYVSMAGAYSQKYDDTTNVFKKKSILKNLSPVFSKGIEAAKSNPYIVVDGSTNFDRGDYSFSKKRYTIGKGSTAGMFAGGGLRFICPPQSFGIKSSCRTGLGQLKVRNYNNMRHIYIKDESTAKKIADYISKGGEIKYKLFGFVYGTQKKTNAVDMEAIKIKLYGPKNKLLLTQNETSLLGKTKVVKIQKYCIKPSNQQAAILFSMTPCFTNGGHLLYQLPDGDLSINQPQLKP